MQKLRTIIKDVLTGVLDKIFVHNIFSFPHNSIHSITNPVSSISAKLNMYFPVNYFQTSTVISHGNPNKNAWNALFDILVDQ